MITFRIAQIGCNVTLPPEFKSLCNTLYSVALLIEGVLPKNPVDLANKVTELLAK